MKHSDSPYGSANKDYMFGDKMRHMSNHGEGNKDYFDYENGNYDYNDEQGWHLKEAIKKMVREALNRR